MTPIVRAVPLFNVRVHVANAARNDTYFDITNVSVEQENEAIGYAIGLATECFGLPLHLLHVRVLSCKSPIDIEEFHAPRT